jgi:ABC-type glycerol-3-phosphate transport system permease component
MLAPMMIPTRATIVSLYTLFTKIGGINSFKPLVVPAFLGDLDPTFVLRQSTSQGLSG